MGRFTLPPEDSDPSAIISAIGKLHECVDKRITRLERRGDTDRKAAAKHREAILASMSAVEEALGIGADSRHTPVAIWSPKKVAGWIATLGGGFYVAAKILNTLLPYVIGAAHALWLSAIH